MIAAFVTSIVFLACYLTYHGYLAMVLHQGPTRFLNPQWFRPIYLTILAHAHRSGHGHRADDFDDAVPRAKRSALKLHKKIARWTWPLWMYVSVTGVMVYFLLYRIFPQK